MFQKLRFLKSRVRNQLLVNPHIDPLKKATFSYPFLEFFTCLRQLRKYASLIRHHHMDQLFTQEIDITKHPIFKANPWQTYRVPDLCIEQGRLTLDENIQEKDIVSGQVDSFLFVNADNFAHCHQDAYLQALYLLLFQEEVERVSGCGGQRHYWDCVEGNRYRMQSICESEVQQGVFGLGFAKIDRRVIGLIGIQDGIDFASKTGLQLLMHQFHHSIQSNLNNLIFTSLILPLAQHIYMKLSLLSRKRVSPPCRIHLRVAASQTPSFSLPKDISNLLTMVPRVAKKDEHLSQLPCRMQIPRPYLVRIIKFTSYLQNYGVSGVKAEESQIWQGRNDFADCLGTSIRLLLRNLYLKPERISLCLAIQMLIHHLTPHISPITIALQSRIVIPIPVSALMIRSKQRYGLPDALSLESNLHHLGQIPMQQLLNDYIFLHWCQFLLINETGRIEKWYVFDLFWFYEKSEWQFAIEGEVRSLGICELLGCEGIIKRCNRREPIH